MIVIGTAGHIDHGKTTLATFLTGIQTDRLKEEQERGISIELGFAYLDLPTGERCGLIDVPGHERFVRHMIAGAAGVDVVLLVVAADEGVMPQTREHLDICKLLGVKHGLVVLTKTDLVDSDWLDMVAADVEEVVRGSFLEGAPTLRFSAVDAGVASAFRDRLLEWLSAHRVEATARDPLRPFRLSVDRVFSMRGFGTVVTGTVATGSIAVGDEVEFVPQGARARVRGIQVHGQAAPQVQAGSRAAINVQGAEKHDIPRGSVLVRASGLASTSMFDATCLLLPNAERFLEPRAKALVHIGTAQIQATLVPLDVEALEPGSEGLIQVRLEQPTLVQAGEAYVLRGFDVLANYGKTIGGGRVLDPYPAKHKALRPDVVASLRALWRGTPEERVEALVGLGHLSGLTRADLLARSEFGAAALGELTAALVQRGTLAEIGGESPLFLTREAYASRLDALEAELREYHGRYPWRPGMPSEELRSKARPPLEPRLFARLLEDAALHRRWVREGDVARLASFAPRLDGDIRRAYEELARTLERGGLEPPLQVDVLRATGVPEAVAREALELLLREERAVRVTSELVFYRAALEELEARVVEFLEREGEMSTSQFKDLFGLSRKFSIPLLEHLDANKVTVRVGDSARTLRPRL